VRFFVGDAYLRGSDAIVPRPLTSGRVGLYSVTLCRCNQVFKPPEAPTTSHLTRKKNSPLVTSKMDLGQMVTTVGSDYLERESRSLQLPSFEYDILEADYIRVLTLLPGQEIDPICCEFQIVSQGAAVSTFSALSYWWGPEPRNLDTILINRVVMGDTTVAGDRSLPIRPNLYNALVALRRGSQEALPLWIDAICINQTCASEKAEQIRHMDQIYTSASNVIIWLGEAGDDSDYVMDSISNKLTSDYTTPRFMASIIAILARPWFTRTWIVQEFVLSRASPLMACGFKSMITWDAFMGAYNAASQLSKSHPVPVPDAQGTDQVFNSGFANSRTISATGPCRHDVSSRCMAAISPSIYYAEIISEWRSIRPSRSLYLCPSICNTCDQIFPCYRSQR
jgi:Heterokaryon incompatibility protein (HET)